MKRNPGRAGFALRWGCEGFGAVAGDVPGARAAGLTVLPVAAGAAALEQERDGKPRSSHPRVAAESADALSSRRAMIFMGSGLARRTRGRNPFSNAYAVARWLTQGADFQCIENTGGGGAPLARPFVEYGVPENGKCATGRRRSGRSMRSAVIDRRYSNSGGRTYRLNGRLNQPGTVCAGMAGVCGCTGRAGSFSSRPAGTTSSSVT